MRAYTQGVDSSLDEEHEVDIFISNLKYALFVNRESVYDRRDPNTKIKYHRQLLVQTIDTLLKQPHSPSLLDNFSKLPLTVGNVLSSDFEYPYSVSSNR
jgi:hypothetical protein